MKYFYTFFALIFFFSVSFAQTVWQKHPNNPIFSDNTGGWTLPIAYGPCILIIDSTYHMWYTGSDGTYGRIGYATSLDGLTWVPCDSNPVLDVGQPGSYEASSVTEPSVIFDGQMFHMWYTGINKASSPWQEAIEHATSPDGIKWTKDTLNNPVLEKGSPGSWDDLEVFVGSVIYDGSMFHMWYSGGKVGSGAIRNTGYATSSDGVNWTKYVNNPVLTTGPSNFWDYPRAAQPKVVYDGNKYHMFYSGYNWFEWRIGYAIAPDETTWTKYGNAPVLNVGNSGDWDSYYVGIPAVVIDTANSVFRMWYSGGGAVGDAHVGYATAPLSIINVPGNYATIQEGIDAADSGDVVLVDESTYYENINFKGKAITVASQYWFDGDNSHISKTIIDGSQPTDPDSGSVVFFVSGEDTTSVLCGFTITGGTGTHNSDFNSYFGGGIYMLTGGKICHNIITDNHLEYNGLTAGAGLFYLAQSKVYNVSFKHNTVTHNSGTSHSIVPSGGGGIYFKCVPSSGGSIRIANNTISHNMVTNTGRYKTIAGGIGIAFDLPSAVEAVIENNWITYNELHCTVSMGAGLYVVYWEPGGQIMDIVPNPVIRNNIIAHNYSQDRGAGIGIWTVQKNHSSSSKINPEPAFINNTIVNNKANDGCGIFNFDSYPLLMNNILWNDLSVEGSREIFNDDIKYPDYTDTNEGDLSIYYSDFKDSLKNLVRWEGDSIINADPDFVDSLFHLSEQSPCVGKGIDSVAVNSIWYNSPSTDYFGTQRPYPNDYLVDIGAIESKFEKPDGITENAFLIPDKFALSQNYPNPFNPKTVIRYALPVTCYLELSIYNILGQKVATLVNKKQPAGSYEVEWDASGFASGIYIYQLKAKGQKQKAVRTKKLVLLK